MMVVSDASDGVGHDDDEDAQVEGKQRDERATVATHLGDDGKAARTGLGAARVFYLGPAEVPFRGLRARAPPTLAPSLLNASSNGPATAVTYRPAAEAQQAPFRVAAAQGLPPPLRTATEGPLLRQGQRGPPAQHAVGLSVDKLTEASALPFRHVVGDKLHPAGERLGPCRPRPIWS